MTKNSENNSLTRRIYLTNFRSVNTPSSLKDTLTFIISAVWLWPQKHRYGTNTGKMSRHVQRWGAVTCLHVLHVCMFRELYFLDYKVISIILSEDYNRSKIFFCWKCRTQWNLLIPHKSTLFTPYNIVLLILYCFNFRLVVQHTCHTILNNDNRSINLSLCNLKITDRHEEIIRFPYIFYMESKKCRSVTSRNAIAMLNKTAVDRKFLKIGAYPIFNFWLF